MSGAGAAQAFGMIVQMIGAHKTAEGYREAGRKAKTRGYQQKAFNDIAATQLRAIGQMAALEEGRQARLLASRAVAVAAAGGAVSDITNLIADIYGEGAYRASVELHSAEMAARKLEFEGEQAAAFGEEQRKAGRRKGQATMLSAFGNMASSSGGFGG